ncbi:hypothetical protein P8452_15776 [Trifolium repens]|nr:hypothetical protein P8452_15776 [Trifolium repens]
MDTADAIAVELHGDEQVMDTADANAVELHGDEQVMDTADANAVELHGDELVMDTSDANAVELHGDEPVMDTADADAVELHGDELVNNAVDVMDDHDHPLHNAALCDICKAKKYNTRVQPGLIIIPCHSWKKLVPYVKPRLGNRPASYAACFDQPTSSSSVAVSRLGNRPASYAACFDEPTSSSSDAVDNHIFCTPLCVMIVSGLYKATKG